MAEKTPAAIIGGGIAGLTCAYRLSQKGIKTTLFEKESFLGGRLLYSGVIGGATVQPNSDNLVKELGLEEVRIFLDLSDMGAILPNGNFFPMEKSPEMMKSFSKEELLYWEKLIGFLRKNLSSFNVKNKRSSEIERLHQISFGEYIKDCPQKLLPLLSFEFNIRTVSDFNAVAADWGLHCLLPLLVLFKKEVYTFEENLIVLANVLAEKIKEKKGKILTDCEVIKIKKKENDFEIFYQKREKREIEKIEADKVVLALPLENIKEIFPEIAFESDIIYKKEKCIFLQGELKYERKVFFGFPQNPANLALLIATIPEEHRFYLLDDSREARLDFLYRDWKVLDERIIESAWPIIPPGGRVPQLKSSIEGVYLCGDFYYFPCHDTSVATAEMVAEMIEKEI